MNLFTLWQSSLEVPIGFKISQSLKLVHMGLITFSFIQPFWFFHIHLHSLFYKFQLILGCINDFSGLLLSDGIMWYPTPSRPWHASFTLTMCLLASVYLCSEVLERDNGVSSKFVRYSLCMLWVSSLLWMSWWAYVILHIATSQSLYPELHENRCLKNMLRQLSTDIMCHDNQTVF